MRHAIVDGFVVYSMPADDPHVAAIRARGLPAVFVDQPLVAGTPFVGVDNRAGSRVVAEHLLGLGHRRLGVVSFPIRSDVLRGRADLARQERVDRDVTRDRLRGYRDAVEAAGLDWSEVQVEERLRSDTDEGRDAAVALLTGPDRPTGILAMSDHLALGVIEAAHALGLRVPDDLSVVGFDDIPRAGADRTRPDHDPPAARGRGELAGELLLGALSGSPGPGTTCASCPPGWWGSTAPPADRG